MSVRVEFRWPESLLERVDEARGDVPRAAWVRRALEFSLLHHHVSPERVRASAEAIMAEPEDFSAASVGLAEDVLARPAEEPERRVSPSGPASPRVPFRRDVKPFQRGGS